MIAQRYSFPRQTLGSLGVALLVAAVAACSGGAPPSAGSATSSPGGPASAPAPTEQPTSQATPAGNVLDLTAIVIPPGSPPSGMTLSDGGGGRAVLEQLPLSPDTAAELLAAPGFVDGRWSRFAGSPEEFEASKGFILTWVSRYASPEDAMGASAILLDELTSDDHYGWDGEDVSLGDGGTCAEGDNPQMGGLHETICVWRHGPLVMVVGGGSENETPIQVDAEAMDARVDAHVP